MELPFRLLLAATVAGLATPAVLSGLTAYEIHQLSVKVTHAIDALVAVAHEFFVAGGGAEDVRVDLGHGIAAKVEYVAMGDAPDGPLAYLVRYKLAGQDEVVLATNPPVPLTGGEGPLSLGPGRHDIRVSYDGEGPVQLEVVV